MLTVKQVAERLRISLSSAYQLIESLKISYHRIGGAIRVSEEQLKEYLEDTKREREEPSPVKGKPSRPQTKLKHIKL